VTARNNIRILRRSDTDRRSGIMEEMLDNGVIYVSGPVTTEIAHAFCAQVMYVSSQDPHRDITIYINSPGGSVSDGLAMIDICRSVPNPIHTIGWGVCASMGAVLVACAADRGRRSAMPNCELMLHQPSTGVQGQATDIVIAAEHVLKTWARLNSLIAAACNQPIEKVESDFDADKWFSADEALTYGLIDRVLAPSVSPLADNDIKENCHE